MCSYCSVIIKFVQSYSAPKQRYIFSWTVHSSGRNGFRNTSTFLPRKRSAQLSYYDFPFIKTCDFLHQSLPVSKHRFVETWELLPSTYFETELSAPLQEQHRHIPEIRNRFLSYCAKGQLHSITISLATFLGLFHSRAVRSTDSLATFSTLSVKVANPLSLVVSQLFWGLVRAARAPGYIAWRPCSQVFIALPRLRFRNATLTC